MNLRMSIAFLGLISRIHHGLVVLIRFENRVAQWLFRLHKRMTADVIAELEK